jgi:phosphate-selective porin OprO and OprP
LTATLKLRANKQPNAKMKLHHWLLAAAVSLSLILPCPASAEGTDTNRDVELEALKQQVQELSRRVRELEQQRAGGQPTNTDITREQIRELDQQVRILGRQRELDREEAAAITKAAPKITVGANGVNFVSADTNFALALHGVLQVDSRNFFANDHVRGNDTFLLRRARPILQGTVYRDFDFLFVPDFGGNTVQIFDALVNYRYSPELQLQAGKFKSPVGLETLQADVNILFNERSLAADLVPNRDVGVALHGDLFNGAASYAIGLLNGAPDYSGTPANSDYDNSKAVAGRVFFQPLKNSDVALLKGLGFGVGGSYEDDHGWTNTSSGLTSGYNTDGQQKFFSYTNNVVGDGAHWRIAPQGSWYYGPFGLFGEYVISDQQVRNVPAGRKADLHNTAWEISAGWILTGEEASPNGVTPKHPFAPKNGQWGAWQVVGRYAELDVDNAAFPNFANPNSSASAAHAWAAGLNWYLNNNLRVDASFSHTWFDGGDGPGATVTKQAEDVLFTRIQLAF